MASSAIQSRRARAVELVIAGNTPQAVADALGCSRKDVDQYVRAYLYDVKRRVARDVEDLRDLEAERLDRLQAAQWSAAMGGDTDAAKTCLAIMKQRQDLLGLAAPKRVDLTIASEIDTEIAALMESLRQVEPQVIEAEVVEG